MSLKVRIVPSRNLFDADYRTVLELCSRVYEEDYEPALRTFQDAVHLLGEVNGALVSHALWCTRWLQVNGGPLLRTAYVEGVATEEAHRRKGYASTLMRRLVGEVAEFDLVALSPSNDGFYARLGWELWRGPLAVRTESGTVPSPSDEWAMIYRLPHTPRLDIYAPLSIEWREGEVW